MIAVQVSFNGSNTVTLHGTTERDKQLLKLAFAGNHLVGFSINGESQIVITLTTEDVPRAGSVIETDSLTDQRVYRNKIGGTQ